MNWIIYDDNLPEPNEVVLACDSISGVRSIGRLIETDEEDYFEWMFTHDIEIDSHPTHWQPFPQLPAPDVVD